MTVGEKLLLAHDGTDIGSSYFNLSCANCSQDLGKLYKSTKQDLDDIREYFTLFVDQCNRYGGFFLSSVLEVFFQIQ